MTENKLPITKEQFNKATIDFIHKYKRLPYLPEDDIEIEEKNKKGEMEIKLYRANRYVTGYYKNQDKMSQELLDNNIITYEMIAEIIGETETIIKNAITKSTKNPDKRVRHAIDMFFNKDYYKELGEYATKCTGCSRRKCKQVYWVEVDQCRNYKKKK